MSHLACFPWWRWNSPCCGWDVVPSEASGRLGSGLTGRCPARTWAQADWPNPLTLLLYRSGRTCAICVVLCQLASWDSTGLIFPWHRNVMERSQQNYYSSTVSDVQLWDKGRESAFLGDWNYCYTSNEVVWGPFSCTELSWLCSFIAERDPDTALVWTDRVLPASSQARFRGWHRPRAVPNCSFDVVTLLWRLREFNSMAMIRQFQMAYEPENGHI